MSINASLSTKSLRLSLLALALVAQALRASDGHGTPEAHGDVGDDLMTEERQDLTSPTDAYLTLIAGNERFRLGKPRAKDLVGQRKAVAHGQHPYATIVSCMDSRTSSELIFDANLGDFFNVRIAGNVVNDDVLGSLEYAHKVAGAKLILVLGHTHCGAVKGAADDVVMGNLTGLVARIRPAIAAIPPDGKPRTSKNLEFVDRAGRMHVIMTVRLIRERSAILRDLQDRGQIDIIGGFYDLETGRVEFYRPLSGAGPVRTTTTLLNEEKGAVAEEGGHDGKAEDKHGAPSSGHGEESHGTPAEEQGHSAPAEKPGTSTPEVHDAHETPPAEAPANHTHEEGEPPAKHTPPAKAKPAPIVPVEDSEPAEPAPAGHGH